jgi:hypothetical protein
MGVRRSLLLVRLQCAASSSPPLERELCERALSARGHCVIGLLIARYAGSPLRREHV